MMIRICLILLLAPAARADWDWGDAGLFAAGAATAFVAHEAGHATANLALGNVPRIDSVSFLGVVPFFSVAPHISCAGDTCYKRDGSGFGAGRRGLALIVLAGFDVQHVTDEILLTRDPDLRRQGAPFRTGMLAFNTLTSVAYVVANWTGAEPGAGDLAGAVRDTGASRALMTTTLLGIAGIDIARWALPDAPWLAWV